MRSGSKSSAAAACVVRVRRSVSAARSAQSQDGAPAASLGMPHSGQAVPFSPVTFVPSPGTPEATQGMPIPSTTAGLDRP